MSKSLSSQITAISYFSIEIKVSALKAATGLLIFFLSANFVYAESSKAISLTDLKGWDVVIDSNAIASEKYAAEEFVKYFKETSGVELSIVNDIDRPSRHIFIGAGDLMKKSKVGFDTKEFGGEDLRIIIKNKNISIAGGNMGGTLYGVYKFLEDYLGVRFLTADFTYVPEITKEKEIAEADVFYHPPFSHYRNASVEPLEFATRLRQRYWKIDDKYGGFNGWAILNHSLLKQLPLEKYGESNPEFYCIWDGQRSIHTHAHYCFEGAGEKMFPIVLKALLEEIENPGSAGRKNYSIAQNDTVWQYCQCDSCQAVAQAEGTNMAPLLKFVNAGAAEVAKKHPDVLIGTLAYGFSRTPPKIMRPLPNVEINLSTMTTCHIHSATDANCPENAKFEKELQKWSEICSHLSIWDYSMYEDNLLPFPNLKVLEDNIRAFRDAGAEGIYLQMDPDPKSINEFGDLRRYVTTSLIWDPNRSGDELTDEFCNLYYGAGGQAIRKWIQLIHDSYSKNANVHIISGRGYQPLWVDPSVAREGVQLVETAINLADNDTQRQRAEKAAIWAYRAVIEPIYHLKDTDRIDSNTADELRPYIDKYFMLCEKYGLADRVSAKKEQLNKILEAPL